MIWTKRRDYLWQSGRYVVEFFLGHKYVASRDGWAIGASDTLRGAQRVAAKDAKIVLSRYARQQQKSNRSLT